MHHTYYVLFCSAPPLSAPALPLLTPFQYVGHFGNPCFNPNLCCRILFRFQVVEDTARSVASLKDGTTTAFGFHSAYFGVGETCVFFGRMPNAKEGVFRLLFLMRRLPLHINEQNGAIQCNPLCRSFMISLNARAMPNVCLMSYCVLKCVIFLFIFPLLEPFLFNHIIMMHVLFDRPSLDFSLCPQKVPLSNIMG